MEFNSDDYSELRSLPAFKGTFFTDAQLFRVIEKYAILHDQGESREEALEHAVQIVWNEVQNQHKYSYGGDW